MCNKLETIKSKETLYDLASKETGNLQMEILKTWV